MIHNYCTKCGRKLECWDKPDGFDSVTGEPNFEQWLACPKFRKWWYHNWMGNYGHDCVRVDGAGRLRWLVPTT